MLKKLLAHGVLAVALGAGGGLAFLYFRPPAMVPAPNIAVDRSEARVARGKYLFSHVSGCIGCHSETDETRFGGPLTDGVLGKGKKFPLDAGTPGSLTAPNITADPETGAASWTDGQILRAMREGIGHDDRVLFPMMPYDSYAFMSDRDAQAVVAFVRTLPAARNPLPKTKIDFPVNLLIKFAPKPVGSVAEPNRADPVAYGKYLSNLAGCRFCHTPEKNNAPIAGREFAGGHEFPITPQARSVSVNLTPDAETGIGKLTEAQFLDKFQSYKDYAAKGSPKVAPELNTVMPWLYYSGMEPDDLKAIFAYLKTLPAISNAVVSHPDAPEEKAKKSSLNLRDRRLRAGPAERLRSRTAATSGLAGGRKKKWSKLGLANAILEA